MLTVSLLGCLHCVAQLGVLVLRLHCLVDSHHMLVPLFERGRELALAAFHGVAIAIAIVLVVLACGLVACIVIAGGHFCFYTVFGKKLSRPGQLGRA
jgi:hypothetical protein